MAVDKSSAICFCVCVSVQLAGQRLTIIFLKHTSDCQQQSLAACILATESEQIKKKLFFFLNYVQTLSEQQFCTLADACKCRNISSEHLHTRSISCLLTSFPVTAGGKHPPRAVCKPRLPEKMCRHVSLFVVSSLQIGVGWATSLSSVLAVFHYTVQCFLSHYYNEL